MAQTFDTNLKEVAVSYIKILRANVTATSVIRDIQENPYYPTLYSLSDTFNKYGISSNAYEVNRETFTELEAPFVAFVSLAGIGKDFVIVTEIGSTEVTFHCGKKKRTTLKKEVFLDRFHGIVWMAEPNDKSGEIDYEKRLHGEAVITKKRYALTASAIVLLLFVVSVNLSPSYSFNYISIILIKLFGVFTCILLLMYELDKSNAFVRNICSGGGQLNCDAVISSRASKIMGITWTDAGFIYFSATTLLLLIPSVTFVDKVKGVSIANAFSAPYILFSLYYQWRVIRQWCRLCLMVQATLFFELIWNIANVNFSNSFLILDFKLVMSSLACVLLTIVTLYTLKPLFKRAKNAQLYEAAYKRLQYNPEIFKGLLMLQSKAPDGWQELGINIGSSEAANTVIKICNPFCRPCGKVHPVLEDIVNSNNNINLKIIFKVARGNNGLDAKVAEHLLAISHEGDIKKIIHSLNEWYSSIDYELLTSKYPVKVDLKKVHEELEHMSRWCIDADIVYTPTLFVNSYRLPLNYKVEELKNIL